jgi:hypothetical protein
MYTVRILTLSLVVLVLDCKDEHESGDVSAQSRTPLVSVQDQHQIQANARIDYGQLVDPSSSALPSRQEQRRLPQQQTQTASVQSPADISLYSQSFSTVATVPSVVSNINSTVSSKPITQNRYNSSTRALPSTKQVVLVAPSGAIPVTQFTSTDSAATATNHTGHRDSNNEIMTYLQLHAFLNRIVHDENEYRQNYGKCHVVGPIHQIGPKLYFNIDKTSKRKKDCYANTAANEDKVR